MSTLRDRARRRVRRRHADLHRRAEPELRPRSSTRRVGDVVVRRPRAPSDFDPSRPATVPASLVDDLDDAARTAADGSTATSSPPASSWSARTTRWSAAAARRRSAFNYTDAPAGHGHPGRSARRRRGARTAPHEVALDVRDRRARPATRSATRSRIVTRHQAAVLTPTLDRHSSTSGRRLASTARPRRSSTPDRAAAVPRRQGRLHHIWVTADRGVSQQELRDAVAAGAARRRPRRVTGDEAADEAASQLLKAISASSDLPADLRRHRPGGRRLPDRQHLLDPGRPAQPRARAAARARAPRGGRSAGRCCSRRSCSGSSASTVGLGLGVRAGHGASAGCSACSGSTWPAQPLVARTAHRRRGLRDRHRGDDGRGVAAGPPDRAGSRRSRRSATTSRCRSRRCGGGSLLGALLVLPARRRCWSACSRGVPHAGYWVGRRHPRRPARRHRGRAR